MGFAYLSAKNLWSNPPSFLAKLGCLTRRKCLNTGGITKHSHLAEWKPRRSKTHQLPTGLCNRTTRLWKEKTQCSFPYGWADLTFLTQDWGRHTWGRAYALPCSITKPTVGPVGNEASHTQVTTGPDTTQQQQQQQVPFDDTAGLAGLHLGFHSDRAPTPHYRYGKLHPTHTQNPWAQTSSN